MKTYPTPHLLLRRTTAVAALAAALLAGGCTAATDEPLAAPSAGSGALDLAAVCPATVVIQAAWTPEAEHGALYHLLGSTYTVDADKKKVSGPLMSGGQSTGVNVEIRAGGPAIGFQNAGAQMYADPSIMLGQVATDDAIGLSAKQPVVGVVAPFDIAPYMIMWDPAANPTFNSIVDIGKTDTPVLYFNGATYMDYLLGSGILRRNQVDGAYDGSPTRFLAEKGKIAQQGFATNEPFIYENALPQWKKPVKFQLIHDTGYPIYPEAITVRADKKAEHAACLKKLVPVIQKSQVDYVKNAGATNELIIKLNDAYKGFPYSKEQAAYSVEQQLKLKIVSNGANTTLGDFDVDRVKQVIDIVSPIYSGQRKEVKSGLTPQDLVTNEFIDPSIGLS
ncbi:nitrate ABC transporter substrate-binding protein [Catellatospora sp. TT07R-123]|uniref:hypothetical protein n=1 Tax=Catellatospora sp. TT07R-123 TaxID=2733863 RepID=UPI001B0EB811|nr:hypothetical protein [Catellatospora sp. TT07R-123]GHJ44286.1 nitrate ABC transporter substrate-binding protein [Catellatospora sp. TT07R-123]